MNKSGISLKSVIGLIAVGIIAAAGWRLMKPFEPVTLGDLAYDVNPRFGYTVYLLEEDFTYQPYYVLTHDYNGQIGSTLLLRKYLLDEEREYEPYINEGYYHAYYEVSSIDRFLNGSFYETLSPAVQESLLDTSITIAAKDALAATNEHTLQITRKVFLPAMSEIMGYESFYVMTNEGKQLAYFKNSKDNSSIAVHENGRTGAWWTRSASIWGTTNVYIVGIGGESALEQTGDVLGVRPAFCLPGDLPVKARYGITPKGTSYVIAWE